MSEDKKNKSFFDILKLGGLDRKFCDVVADRNLKLAGFTLTSLALALGFFQEANSATDVILVTLLFSLFLFLVGSQLAHNAEKFYEIFLADIFESASIIILMLQYSPQLGRNLKGLFHSNPRKVHNIIFGGTKR